MLSFFQHSIITVAPLKIRFLQLLHEIYVLSCMDFDIEAYYFSSDYPNCKQHYRASIGIKSILNIFLNKCGNIVSNQCYNRTLRQGNQRHTLHSQGLLEMQMHADIYQTGRELKLVDHSMNNAFLLLLVQ